MKRLGKKGKDEAAKLEADMAARHAAELASIAGARERTAAEVVAVADSLYCVHLAGGGGEEDEGEEQAHGKVCCLLLCCPQRLGATAASRKCCQPPWLLFASLPPTSAYACNMALPLRCLGCVLACLQKPSKGQRRREQRQKEEEERDARIAAELAELGETGGHHTSVAGWAGVCQCILCE
jgi:hypothetical protein